MAISYNVENDGLYLQGIEKGIEKGINKGVAKSAWLLYRKGQSIDFIATTLELTIEQVNTAIKEWEVKS